MVSNKKTIWRGWKLTQVEHFFSGTKKNTRNVIWQNKWIDLCLKGWVNLRFFWKGSHTHTMKLSSKNKYFVVTIQKKKKSLFVNNANFFSFSYFIWCHLVWNFGGLSRQKVSHWIFFFSFWIFEMIHPVFLLSIIMKTYRATFNSFSSIIYNKAKA